MLIRRYYYAYNRPKIYAFLEEGKELSMEESLTQQKRILEQRRKQLDTVIHCMDKAIVDCKKMSLNVDELLNKLKLITKNRTADENFWELRKYSDKTLEWNPWIFEQAEMKERLSVLDAGAGYGNLWRMNLKRMPDNCKVTCIDLHNTWADDFEKYVQEETEKGNYQEETFKFLWGDMDTFSMTELRRYEIELSFDEKDCYDFLMQSYKDVKSELEKSQNELLKYLKQIKETKGMISMKRDTYLLYCKK